jgi:hypothetical protein
MKNHTDKFFARVYNIKDDEYGDMVERNEPGEFFKELYGQELGADGGALPESHKSAFYIDQGVDCLENKIIRFVDPETEKIIYKDEINDYFFNSDGFRSNYDFDGSEEIIFTGCSHTLGEGVPEDTTWGAQVSSLLGLRYANISRAGASVGWCVDAVLGYLKKYKSKPKYILALFPDFHRVLSVPNSLVTTTYQERFDKKAPTTNSIAINTQWTWDNLVDVPGYIKKPFGVDITTSRETALLQNLRAISFLETYCEAVGIKLIWSTWAPDEEELFYNTKIDFPEMLKNYITVEARHWHSKEDQEFYDIYHREVGHFGTNWSSYGNCITKENCSGILCHSELEEKYGSNFHLGTDWPGNPCSAHFGIHKHTHFAEKFLEALKYGT